MWCSIFVGLSPKLTNSQHLHLHSINIYEIANPNTISPAKPFLPNCSIDPLCSNEVCDTTLSITARAAALISAMTLKEKVQNVVNSAAGSSRLGLPPYQVSYS